MTLFKLNLFLLIRVLKRKKKKIALTLFHCLGQETWLDDHENFFLFFENKFILDIQSTTITEINKYIEKAYKEKIFKKHTNK